MGDVPAEVAEEVAYAVDSLARVRACFCETHGENVEASMEILTQGVDAAVGIGAPRRGRGLYHRYVQPSRGSRPG